MMRNAWLATVLLPAASLAQARFQVDARVERDGTNGPLIAVAFTVPERFYLYQDRLRVEAEAPTTIVPLPQPDPKAKKDPESGETAPRSSARRPPRHQRLPRPGTGNRLPVISA